MKAELTEQIPETLTGAIRHFGSADTCHEFLTAMRWPRGVRCPHCNSKKVGELVKSRRVWNCKTCRKQFSVKVGTIFEDSPLGLEKWLPATWLIVNAKNGISSCELARALGVTQKTGWFMLHRIRLAMQNGFIGKFSGRVEADETYIGARHATCTRTSEQALDTRDSRKLPCKASWNEQWAINTRALS